MLRSAFVRQVIAKQRLASMGDGAKIDSKVNIMFASNVSIGKKVKIQNGTVITAGPEHDRSVYIGDYALVGGNVLLATASYDVADKLTDYIRNYPPRRGPIYIAEGAFVGWYSIVLPNVRIGKKAIIKPFSVVTEDVPDNTVWSGVGHKDVLSR